MTATFDEPSIRTHLLKLVQHLTNDMLLRQDLFQEAQLHLWQTLARCQGQKPAWYERSCRLHLANLLRAGAWIQTSAPTCVSHWRMIRTLDRGRAPSL